MNCPNCGTPLKVQTVGELDKVWEVCRTCDFVAPKNHLKVEAVWAFLSVDPRDDNEGIPAVKIGDMVMPLIAADPDRVQSLRDMAVQMVRRGGIKIRLVKFTGREEVEVIE